MKPLNGCARILVVNALLKVMRIDRNQGRDVTTWQHHINEVMKP